MFIFLLSYSGRCLGTQIELVYFSRRYEQEEHDQLYLLPFPKRFEF